MVASDNFAKGKNAAGVELLTEFRVLPHEVLPGNQMVEMWRDGVFVAGIYPHEDGIRIVSKYITGLEREGGSPSAAVVHLIKEGG